MWILIALFWISRRNELTTLRHPHFSNQNRSELLVEINATSIRLILLVWIFDLPQLSKLDEYDSQLEARYLKYALVHHPKLIRKLYMLRMGRSKFFEDLWITLRFMKRVYYSCSFIMISGGFLLKLVRNLDSKCILLTFNWIYKSDFKAKFLKLRCVNFHLL